MADEKLGLTLEANNKGWDAAFRQAEVSARELGREVAAAGQSFRGMVDGSISGLGKLNQAIEGAKKIIDFGKEALELAHFSAEMKNLEARVPIKTLRMMQDATEGAVDKITLMKFEMRALTGELHLTEAGLDVVLKAANTLGDQGFGDTTENAEALLSALRKGSSRELKQFGISLDDVADKNENMRKILEATQKLAETEVEVNPQLKAIERLQTAWADSMTDIKSEIGSFIIWLGGAVQVMGDALNIAKGARNVDKWVANNLFFGEHWYESEDVGAAGLSILQGAQTDVARRLPRQLSQAERNRRGMVPAALPGERAPTWFEQNFGGVGALVVGSHEVEVKKAAAAAAARRRGGGGRAQPYSLFGDQVWTDLDVVGANFLGGGATAYGGGAAPSSSWFDLDQVGAGFLGGGAMGGGGGSSVLADFFGGGAAGVGDKLEKPASLLDKLKDSLASVGDSVTSTIAASIAAGDAGVRAELRQGAARLKVTAITEGVLALANFWNPTGATHAAAAAAAVAGMAVLGAAGGGIGGGAPSAGAGAGGRGGYSSMPGGGYAQVRPSADPAAGGGTTIININGYYGTNEAEAVQVLTRAFRKAEAAGRVRPASSRVTRYGTGR